jgi:hypothetical protein
LTQGLAEGGFGQVSGGILGVNGVFPRGGVKNLFTAEEESKANGRIEDGSGKVKSFAAD